MVVFLRLTMHAMGYFLSGYKADMTVFEAGVDICASLLKKSLFC
jgi:hypothetical protein